ncbi:hypothetical protein BDV06DRAFT_227766 [Aspergillus oleicola]
MSSVDLDVLADTIDRVSEKTLRDVFKSICAKSLETRQEAASKLLVDGSQKRKRRSSSETGSPVFGPGPKDPKMAAQALQAASVLNTAQATTQVARYAFCSNCEKEYDVTTNSSTSCVYHPEKHEPVGEELWVDNDFNSPDDSMSEFEDDFPHCFEFPCCRETLKSNPTGCETDWHMERPAAPPTKRFRAW